MRSAHNVTSDLFDVIIAAQRRILEMRAVEPTLEDVLVSLAGDEAR